MNREYAVLWEPTGSIDAPCADLGFAYAPPDTIEVRMRFSNVIDGHANDLLLKFSGAIAAQWETESFGLIPLPESLPKCLAKRWDTWTFPLLQIEHSRWLATYDTRHPIAAEGRVHFALVTMNDLLHVLARPTVVATWVPPKQ